MRYYYEVHVNVPDWKLYKFQFEYEGSAPLIRREEIIEEVINKGLLNLRSHLSYITVAKPIPKEQFLPDDELYFKTTMTPEQYNYHFRQKPQSGECFIESRHSYKKPKKIYAKAETRNEQ